MIYQHMRSRGFAASEIGDDDGVFWMSLTDFFLNFENLYLCRFFDDSWQELSYEGSWNVAGKTAGGCTNFDTCGDNPQLLVNVNTNFAQSDIECFMSLKLRTKPGEKRMKTGIGFKVFEYNKGV